MPPTRQTPWKLQAGAAGGEHRSHEVVRGGFGAPLCSASSSCCLYGKLGIAGGINPQLQSHKPLLCFPLSLFVTSLCF